MLAGGTASLAAGLATGVGALPILGLGRPTEAQENLLLGFAAGVMLVASAVGFVALVEAGYAPEYEKVRVFMRGLLFRTHADASE